MPTEEQKVENEKQEPIEISKKTNTFYTSLSRSDKIGLAGLLIAILFGTWGIILTIKVGNTSVDVAHFDSLLNKTDKSLTKQSQLLLDNGILINLSQKQIDSLVSINQTLTKQFDVLSKQYAITLGEQKVFNLNNANTNISNEARFYIATQNLHLLTWQPRSHPSYLSEWDLNLKIPFLNRATEILNGQLDNPFLLNNKYMLADWLNVRDSVFWYVQDINFLPQQPLDTLSFGGMSYEQIKERLRQEWKNCYIGVAELEQSTFGFMSYYRFRGRKIKKPTKRTYEEIIKLQRR